MRWRRRRSRDIMKMWKKIMSRVNIVEIDLQSFKKRDTIIVRRGRVVEGVATGG